MTIGEKIRYLRTQKGMTQQELAEKIGIKYSASLRKYESNRYKPKLEQLKKIADVLDVSINYFNDDYNEQVQTNSDFISLLFSLEKSGVKLAAESDMKTRTANINLSVVSPEIATFIKEWNSIRERMEKGTISQKDYEAWQMSILQMYNTPFMEM